MYMYNLHVTQWPKNQEKMQIFPFFHKNSVKSHKFINFMCFHGIFKRPLCAFTSATNTSWFLRLLKGLFSNSFHSALEVWRQPQQLCCEELQLQPLAILKSTFFEIFSNVVARAAEWKSPRVEKNDYYWLIGCRNKNQ